MNYIANITDEMFRWFDIFNEKYFENKLENPIITIQKSKANNYGHFTLGKVWKKDEDDSQYEINIAAHSLHRNAEDIAGTILHEMIHYYHKVNDIKDCSQNKHNKKFKNKAEELGFIVTQSKSYGWGHTDITGNLKEFILNEVQPKNDVFKYARVDRVKPKAEKTMFKYVCQHCETKAMAKRDVELICGVCNNQMTMEE